MEKEKYILKVEPITCVHIGNGEELTPLDYCIVSNPKTGKTYFIKYSSDSILRRCATDKNAMNQFELATSSKNMKNVLNFFVEKRDIKMDEEYRCETTREFVANYRNNKDRDPLENGRFVQQMYRPEGANYPIIPGTSLKGSIRTAVLNELLENYPLRNKLRGLKDNKIQTELLGSFVDAKEDPFRAVEISDCLFDAKGTQSVGIIKNIKTGRDNELTEHNTSTLQAEIIKGKLYEKNCEVVGLSNIRFNANLSRKDLPEKGISKKISKEEIIRSCNNFYWRAFEDEYRKFYKDAVDKVDSITRLYKELKDISNSQTNSFVIKVGRWSQVEYVTYGNDFRNPKTPTRKGKVMPYGTTRWLFNNDGQYLPLGWCKCTIEDEK